MKRIILLACFLMECAMMCIAQEQGMDKEKALAQRVFEAQNSGDRTAFYKAEEDFMSYLLEKKDWAKYYNAWVNKVIYDLNNGNYFRSYAEIMAITEDIKTRKKEEYRYIPYQTLGIYYLNRGNYEISEQQLQNALKAIDKKNKVATFNTILSLAQVSSFTNKQRALEYLDQLPDLGENPIVESGILGFRCIIYESMGKRQDFYRCYQPYDSIKKNVPQQFNAANYYQVMVCHHLYQKNYEQALAWCDSTQDESASLSLRVKVYKEMKEWEKALATQELLDSIDSKRRSEVMMESLAELDQELKSIDEKAKFNKTRMRLMIFVGILLLSIIALLLILLYIRRRHHHKLKEQFDLINEERQRTHDALAIRQAFVNTIHEQLKEPINILLHYARVFNTPGFRLDPIQRPKTFFDIKKSAKDINRMLDPILDSYINKSKGISLEQKQRCQEALRSPMQALIGLTNIITDDHLLQIPEDDYLAMRQEVCNNAYEVAMSAHELILYSATDEYSKTPHSDNVPLNETIKSMLDSYDLRNKVIDKRFETTVSNEVTIDTDIQTLREILYMLFSNADKYALEGTLTVSTRKEADGTYTIGVQNMGSTVPIEEYKNIFQPFCHIPKQKAGLGLGLALAKKLCKSLGYGISPDASYLLGTRILLTGL